MPLEILGPNTSQLDYFLKLTEKHKRLSSRFLLKQKEDTASISI